MSARTAFRAFQTEFAHRLKEARGATSQNRLARELEYSQQMISRYESGRVPKCFLLLARMAERKQLDLNWLLTGVAGNGAATAASGKSASADAAQAGPPRDRLAEELTPELYEGYEFEAAMTLLRMWVHAAPPLRAQLADRVASIAVWWRFREPELAGDLDALGRSLRDEGLAFRGPVLALAERFRKEDTASSRARAVVAYGFLLVTCEEHGLERDRAVASIRLGQLHRKAGAWKKSKEHYTAGLRLAESLDDPFLLEEVWAGLGNLAADLRDLPAARSCYRKELEAAMRTGDPQLRLRTYVSLSLVAVESRQGLREGLAYAERGLSLCDELGEEEYAAELLINRAAIVGLLGRRDEARSLYEEAVRRAPSQKAARVRAVAYHNGAELCLEDGEASAALELLARAEACCEEAQLPGVRCSVLMNRARAQLAAGLLRDAVRSSRQAIRLAEQQGLESFQTEAQILNDEIEERVPTLTKIA